jgi:hypothetical protein
MISLKTLIVEGRYDSLVTELSRKLLTVVKDSYSACSDATGTFAGEKIYYDKAESAPNIISDEYPHIFFEEVENQQIPLDFYLTCKIMWKEGLSDLKYGADAYNDTKKESEDPPLIEVRFELDPAKYPNTLSDVAMHLRDILRHELEHLTQSGWNVKLSKYLPSDQATRKKIEAGTQPPVDYFLLKKEIPAMIHGMYLKAKKSKQPFKTVVNNYLDIWVDNGSLTSQDKERILTVWRTYLPKLSIRQEL